MKPQTIFLLCIALFLFVENTFGHMAEQTDEDDKENAKEKNDDEETKKPKEKKKTKRKSDDETDSFDGEGILKKMDDVEIDEEKQFRGLVLDNKLKVILIHDENADTAAMTMFVGAGIAQAPVEVQGLPGLVQFTITEGDEKYKKPSDFMNYIESVGGSWNGYLDNYYTGFYCTCPADNIIDTVDRFSSLFYKPLFKQDRIDANVKIINDAYQLTVEDEESRLEAVKKSTFPKGSIFTNFPTGSRESRATTSGKSLVDGSSCYRITRKEVADGQLEELPIESPLKFYDCFDPQRGNIKTLETDPKEQGIDVRDEMLKFFDSYYSSDKMGLALLGKESLDELQKIAVEYFGALEANHVKVTRSKHGPLTEKELKKRISVVALMDTYYMELDFSISDPTPDYKNGPMLYLRYFLENEGVGSLYSFLHKSGLVTAIWTVTEVYNKGAAVLEVRFQLTKAGLEQADNIIINFFEYIAMVKQNGVQESVYNEIAEVATNRFKYPTDKSWFALVYYAAMASMDYPLADVYSHVVPEDFDKTVLQDYIDSINPDNMRVILRAKQFAESADQTASWIPVNYKIEDIPQETIDAWNNVQPNENFAMPKPNECIPENFDLLELESEAKIPEIVEDTDVMRLWLYQDPVFLLPINYLSVYLRSPAFWKDAKTYILAEYYTILFFDAMMEMTYDAYYAGYSFYISRYEDTIVLSFEGFSDKFDILVVRVFEYVTKFEFTPEIFDIKKDELKRYLENWKSYDSYQLANYYMWLLLSSRDFTGDELLAALEQVTIDEVKEFNANILKQIFVEAFLYGNVNKEYAKTIYDVINPYIKDSKPYRSNDLIYSKEIILKKGKIFVYPVQAITSDSYAITAYYQCNQLSHRGLALIDLFNEVIDKSYNDAIRMDEQVSYMFFKIIRIGDDILGLYLSIQSTFENIEIDEILEKYLATIADTLEELSDEDLNAYKESVKYRLTMKIDHMDQQYSRFNGEISGITYDFESNLEEAAKVDDITKDDLIEFCNTYFNADSPKRTKLLVYVIPKEKEDTYKAPEQAIVIGDIWKFRKSQTQSDPAKQFGDYPPIGADD